MPEQDVTTFKQPEDDLTIQMNCKSKLNLVLEAQADLTYDNAYHNNLRGCILNRIPDRLLDNHEDSTKPIGINFSNPFPPGDAQEGETMYLDVSSVNEEHLVELAKSVQEDPEFNIGEMKFEVVGLNEYSSDVGEPGTSGTIETFTGVHVRFSPKEAEEYGLETNGNEQHFWRDTDSLEAFKDRIEAQLELKWDHLIDEDHHNNGPHDVEAPLFDSYELIKTFGVPLTVTEGQTLTVVLSKWRFKYTILSEAHRDALNMALATGIGSRTGMGLGWIKLKSKSPPKVLTDGGHKEGDTQDGN